MSNKYSKEELKRKILKEFSKLSKRLAELSYIFDDFSKNFFKYQSKENKELNQQNENSFTKNKADTSIFTQGEGEKKKKYKRKGKIGLGRIFKVPCMVKGKEIDGYKLITKYYSLHLILGPFENFKFVTIIRDILQKEVTKLKFGKYNFKTVITDFFRQFKALIYREYPPLDNEKVENVFNNISNQQI